MRFLSLLACLLLPPAPGLGAAGGRPDWISGTSASYPKSAYMTGVGQGPTQEKAADKARAEIAKGFSLSLTAKTQATAQETSYGSDSSVSQFVSDDVRTSTVKVLDGVEIARYWQDEQGAHYALAVLNRGHSLNILGDKLAEHDRSLEDLFADLEKAEGKFEKLRAALKLLQAAKSRRRTNADYRILNPEGKGIPPPAAQSSAVSQARKALAELTIQVEAGGEKAEKIASRIIDGLSAYGLRVVERHPTPPDLIVEAKASAERLPPENLLWFWARGTILVRLSYGSTGEVFTRFEESGQQAARDPGSAVDATLLALADRTSKHVYAALTTTAVSGD